MRPTRRCGATGSIPPIRCRRTPPPRRTPTRRYVTAQQGRQQVVYVGANDGLLHGFRSGIYNASTGTFTNNDGHELLAYMPGAIVQNATAGRCSRFTAALTRRSTTRTPSTDTTSGSMRLPATGDVFFGGQWHTWLVGGLGAGGAAIYALDVTNPANFSEAPATAASMVIGEWNFQHHHLRRQRHLRHRASVIRSARRRSAACTTASGR